MRLELLTEVSEGFAAYLSEVTDGDLAASTPCQLWTIDDLYHHMVELNVQLDAQSSPPMAHNGCMARETVYRDSARHATDVLAHAADSTPAGRVSTPFGALSPQDAFESYLTNTVVHTWDLAQALGFDFDPPRQDALDITLGCLRRMPPGRRGAGTAFAVVQDFVPGSATEEILLLSGRGRGRASPAARCVR
jgi:uncharacterized protein (TIGR03086 family)